jgi:dCTP deaminase
MNPNSYDLTLHEDILIYRGETLDPRIENETLPAPRKRDGSYLLTPGRVYLARTVEYTETHGLVPMINGKGSLGRLGLFVHVTAGFGDVGFCGTGTLELVATPPVKVYPGMRIAQIYYQTVVGLITRYDGRYQGQVSPTASRGHL